MGEGQCHCPPGFTGLLCEVAQGEKALHEEQKTTVSETLHMNSNPDFGYSLALVKR